MTKEDILFEVSNRNWDIYPGMQNDKIYTAMEEYAKQVAIDFANWQLSIDCPYSATDENQWTHNYNQSNITTEELFKIYENNKRTV